MTETNDDLLVEVFDFLDGLCIGHVVADRQRFKLAGQCWSAMAEESRRKYELANPKFE